MEDTRNWELMPSIGGNRPNIQDLPQLKLAEESPECILHKIAIERAVGQFQNGEMVTLPDTTMDQVSLIW